MTYYVTIPTHVNIITILCRAITYHAYVYYYPNCCPNP